MTERDKFLDLGEIYLRSLRQEDLEGSWYLWFNDPVVTRYQNKGIIPNTREKQADYFRHIAGSSEDVVLAIVHEKTAIHIGNIGLHKIDYIHRHAEVGIVIGEKEFWKKGYATKCVNAMAGYAFGTLNLHRVYAIIMEENTASLKTFEHAGFLREGVMKGFFFKNGSYRDVIMLGKINPGS